MERIPYRVRKTEVAAVLIWRANQGVGPYEAICFLCGKRFIKRWIEVQTRRGSNLLPVERRWLE